MAFLEVIQQIRRKLGLGTRIPGTLPYAEFPEELLLLILENLSLRSLMTITNVNHQHYDLVQDPKIWQLFIQKYFPYLVQHQAAKYQNLPKALFIKEYQFYKKFISPNLFPMEWILTALNGQRGKLPPILSADAVHRLSAFSAINRYDTIESLTIQARHQALLVTTLTGNVTALKNIFSKNIPLNNDYLRNLWVHTARHGHFEIMELLETKITPSQLERGSALLFGAQNNHLAVVKRLLTSPVPTDVQVKALINAAQQGYADIVASLANENVLSALVQEVFNLSAIKDDSPIVKVLLRNAHHKINILCTPLSNAGINATRDILVWARGKARIAFYLFALEHAVKNGQFLKLLFLLNNPVGNITTVTKSALLKDAMKGHYHEIHKAKIVNALLAKFENDCSAELKAELLAMTILERGRHLLFLPRVAEVLMAKRNFAIAEADKTNLFYLGCSRGSISVVRYTVAMGIDNIPIGDIFHQAHCALLLGHAKITQFILTQHGQRFSAIDMAQLVYSICGLSKYALLSYLLKHHEFQLPQQERKLAKDFLSHGTLPSAPQSILHGYQRLQSVRALPGPDVQSKSANSPRRLLGIA